MEIRNKLGNTNEHEILLTRRKQIKIISRLGLSHRHCSIYVIQVLKLWSEKITAMNILLLIQIK